MSKINVALIGYGYWGSKLKRYLDESGEFAAKYVCDSKSDLEGVFRDTEVTSVMVATPNDTHYSIVKAALLAGKDVLCEKPLALRVSECEELRQLAEKSNRLLMVEYTWTFSLALKQAQSMALGGEIGEILGIEMAIKQLGRFGRGSVYWLLGSHLLAVLDMFIPLGSLSFAKTDLVTFEGEVETGYLSFTGEGVSGRIDLSLNYPGKETKVIVYGERGTIVYNPMTKPSLVCEGYKRQKWVIGSELLKGQRDLYFGESDNLRYAIDHFAKVLEGEAGGNIDRAVAVTRVIEGLVDG